MDRRHIATICRNLDNDSTELIDFDELRKILTGLHETCESFEKTGSELELIKGEYRNRIIGMLKANLACREDAGEMEMVARLSGDLSQVEAGELIKSYSRVAARFRSNFPASFRYLGFSNQTGRANDWMDHKI